MRDVRTMEIQKLIDSTLLRPEATEGEIARLCEEALEYGFAAVCTNSCHAGTVSRLLPGNAPRAPGPAAAR